MKQSPCWETNSSSVKKNPLFYVTQNSLNVPARHLFFSWARSVQSAPQSYSSNIHFSTPICASVFSSGFPTRTLGGTPVFVYSLFKIVELYVMEFWTEIGSYSFDSLLIVVTWHHVDTWVGTLIYKHIIQFCLSLTGLPMRIRLHLVTEIFKFLL
jgi:hypothetical protein